jgi:hypothetical protein
MTVGSVFVAPFSVVILSRKSMHLSKAVSSYETASSNLNSPFSLIEYLAAII